MEFGLLIKINILGTISFLSVYTTTVLSFLKICLWIDAWGQVSCLIQNIYFKGEEYHINYFIGKTSIDYS